MLTNIWILGTITGIVNLLMGSGMVLLAERGKAIERKLGPTRSFVLFTISIIILGIPFLILTLAFFARVRDTQDSVWYLSSLWFISLVSPPTVVFILRMKRNPAP